MREDTEVKWTGERRRPDARIYTTITAEMPSADPIDVPVGLRAGTHKDTGLVVRRCADQRRGKVLRYGHCTMMDWEGRYLSLIDERMGVLATTSLAERQSRTLAARCARGTVVVHGLGMGTFLHHVVALPQVERVFAVDGDWHVLSFVRDRSAVWDGNHKIEFIHGNLVDVTKGLLANNYQHLNTVDFLYVDIWRPEWAMDYQRIHEVRDAVEGLLPFVTWFHGQEIAMVEWMRNHRSPPLWDLSRMNLDHFDEWCIHVGMTLGHRSEAYLDYARTCWAVHRARRDHDALRSVSKVRKPGPRWHAKSMYRDSDGKIKTDEVWLYASDERIARCLVVRVLEDDFGMSQLLDMRLEVMR